VRLFIDLGPNVVLFSTIPSLKVRAYVYGEHKSQLTGLATSAKSRFEMKRGACFGFHKLRRHRTSVGEPSASRAYASAGKWLLAGRLHHVGLWVGGTEEVNSADGEVHLDWSVSVQNHVRDTRLCC